MPDFKGIINFDLVIVFIVPGLIMTYVRSRFVSGRKYSYPDNIISYIVLSLVYYSILSPLLHEALASRGSWILSTALWIGITLVGPAFVGLGLGAWAQNEIGEQIASKFGLRTVDLIPTAWDWCFSRFPRGGMFVMVTLSDNSRVAGFFGAQSFASSDKDERGLYLEEEYEVSDDGEWRAREDKVGIFVSGGDIRYIEFWERREGHDD